MSIDAIGSAKLKSNLPSETWLELLLDFLPEFQVTYRTEFLNAKKECEKVHHCTSVVPCLPPHPWKYLGDEVVLVTDLICQYQPHFYVAAFIKALNTYNRDFEARAAELNITPLQFKATAWVAGFPVTNVEVLLPREGTESANLDASSVADYIGPSIDIGFRLSKYSTSKRLVISPSLAFLLAPTPPVGNISTHEIFYGGLVPIKGVRPEKSYPLFWLHPTGHEDKAEEHILKRLSAHDVATFFRDFFGEESQPFILNNSYPPSYEEKFEQAAKRLKKIKYTIFFEDKGKTRNKTSTPKEDTLTRIQSKFSKK